MTSEGTNQPVEEGQPREARAGYSYAVRSRTFVPLLGLLVAAVLALAVAGLRYERNRLMGDFGTSQQETAEQLVTDLEKELADLDDDGRLVSTLLSRARTRPSLDAADEDSFLLAGFQALATVVRHYRAIYLFRKEAVAVRAIDPAETAPVGQAFLAWSIPAAQDAGKTGRAGVQRASRGTGRPPVLRVRATGRIGGSGGPGLGGSVPAAAGASLPFIGGPLSS